MRGESPPVPSAGAFSGAAHALPGLERERRRGRALARPVDRAESVQHALVDRALRDAGARADLATATVEPGSTSQRTFERLGFRVLYTRALFVRPCAAT